MSQTMSKEIQTIHYCTILSAGQWDFLLEGRFSPLRQKCLYRLMNGAVRTRTAYKIKGVDIVLEVGQAAASDVELAEFFSLAGMPEVSLSPIPIMSDLRLPPKDRRAMCGHLFPTVCRQGTNREAQPLPATQEGKKRTA